MSNSRWSVGVLALAIALSGCARSEHVFGHADVDEPSSADAGFAVGPPVRLQELIVADTPPPPLSGGTLAVAADGSVVVAADPDRDLVYIVRPNDDDVRTVALVKGSEPGRVALDGNGRAHVALRAKGSVIAIDLASAVVIAETPVCTLPRGIAYDVKRDAVVVACASGELVTLAAADHAQLSNKQVALDLRDVVIGADGALSVSRYRSAELLRFGADGELSAKSAPLTMKQTRFQGKNADVNGFVDPGPTPITQIAVTMSPALAWKTVSANDGSSIMLHQESQDDEVVIQGTGGYGGGCETITQASITRYDADGAPINTMTLAPHGLVVDVAVSPDGRWLALAEPGVYLQGGPTLELVMADGLQQPLLAVDAGSVDAGSVDAGPGPVDAGTPPPDALLPPIDAGFSLDAGSPSDFLPSTCISGPGDGSEVQTTAVAFDAQGTLYALSREPAVLTIYHVFNGAADGGAPEPDFFWPLLEESAHFKLAASSVRDTGHELFHTDVGSGLSCAGCHGEALDDGHVWNFRDFGPRRTQTMRGGLLSTLPLHWEGDLPSFNHLIDEVMTRRMGGFTVEPKYGDALANWLDKLPPLKLGSAEAAPADSIARGKELFASEEVACATCHSGPHFTNNQSFDVGTGGMFQVPILNGLALHPPFMHDGCAATLRERFDPACGGDDRHGHTSHLSDAQIADLVSYLQTL